MNIYIFYCRYIINKTKIMNLSNFWFKIILEDKKYILFDTFSYQKIYSSNNENDLYEYLEKNKNKIIKNREWINLEYLNHYNFLLKNIWYKLNLSWDYLIITRLKDMLFYQIQFSEIKSFSFLMINILISDYFWEDLNFK